MLTSLLLALLLATGCIRPSSDYEVNLHGEGTQLDEILPAPTPMGGRIELIRFRLWGTNLGLGLTGLFGDSPRSDGVDFVMANAEFGYPRDPAFDRSSYLFNPGPPLVGQADPCYSRGYSTDLLAVSEYVDVGDHVALTTGDGDTLRLDRDPSVYPRPAGESFYVGYGQRLLPVVEDHPELPATWRSAASWSITAPGTLPPADATVGAIPYPLTGGVLTTPPTLEDLRVEGEPVRPPHHGYDARGVYVGEDAVDDVRFPGPWNRTVELTWEPAGHPVTLTLRYLDNTVEGTCGCASDCAAGFSCDGQGQCVSDEGVTGLPTGELTCTLHDDGLFTLTPEHLADLNKWVPESQRDGAILIVSRVSEGTMDVPDVRTHNDKRIAISPVRIRAADLTITRLEAP